MISKNNTDDHQDLLSVIIPTYNNADYIGETIDSVLAQTYPAVEIIVVNDGGTDHTPEVVRAYGDKVRYFEKPNGGVASARNLGLREARGEYVAFLDSDDLWLPTLAEEEIARLREDPEVGMACCLMENINASGARTGMVKPKVFPGKTVEELIAKGSALPSTFIMRRELLDRIGGFDEELIIFEDLDLALRIAEVSRIVILEKILALYRLHPHNTTKNETKVFRYQVVFARKWLARGVSPTARAALNRRLAKYAYWLFRHNLKAGRLISAGKYFGLFCRGRLG